MVKSVSGCSTTTKSMGITVLAEADQAILKIFAGWRMAMAATTAYSHTSYLCFEKFNKEEIHKIFDLINKWIFKDPLKSTEIEVMFSHKVFEETEALFFDGNRFMHNELAKWIQASHFVKKYAGELWVYKDGVYEADSSFIETRMVEQIPRLTRLTSRDDGT